jgi:transcriptional regulator with XRE-family HTH domain
MQKSINNPTLERFGQRLTEARRRKGLSQRDLGERTATPQAHISKIEQGRVDLRLSSLAELARALDLDVQLVPRQAAAAVDGLVRSVEADLPSSLESRVLADLGRFDNFLERLRENVPNPSPIDALELTLADLRKFPFDKATWRRVQNVLDAVERSLEQGLLPGRDEDELGLLVNANRTLRAIRNDFAHARPAPISEPQPLYQLGGDDDD